MGKRYREMQIRTASPVALVVQMYDGAIQRIHQARELHGQGKISQRGAALSVALGVLAELRQALDHDQGGEIARNLDSLYLFVSERLVDFNLQGSVDACDEALRVLQPLRDAWAEIAQRPDETKLAEVG